MPFTVAAHSARWPLLSDDHYRERLKSKCIVDPVKGCWLWQAYIYPEPNPYGGTSYRGANWRAHRLAYFLWKGPLDPALDVCHDCDVKHCCNPDHLWQGTPKANMQDASKKKIWSRQHKTHCPHGHPYSGDNLYVTPQGKRNCKECARLKNREYTLTGRAAEVARMRRARLKAQRLLHQL